MNILLNFLLIFFLALFALLSYKRLDRAVLFIIAATPLYLIRFKMIGIPFTVFEAMILIAFGIWFVEDDGAKIKAIFKRKNPAPYPYKWEMAAVLIISLIAVITAGINKEALGIFKAYFIEPLLLFILTIDLFPNKAGRKKIVLSLAISALLVSLFAIYQKITGQFISNPFWAAADTRRAVSFFGYPNAVGLFLAPLTMIFIGYLFTNNSKKEKVLFIVTIISSILAIIFAQSEGALIGLAAAIFVFALIANKKLRISAIIIGLAISITIFAYPPFKKLVFEKATLNDLSGQIRRQQWFETKKMLLDGRIIQGAGLSNYQKTVAPYHQAGIFIKNDDPKWLSKLMHSEEYRKQMWQPTEIYMYPHNIFLNFWSELGIFGALLFCWIIAKFLWQSGYFLIKEKDHSERYFVLGLAASMIALVVHGLVDVPYFKNDLAALFWVIIALLSGLTYKLNENNTPKIDR